jgi:hypothetical protein
MFLPKEQVFVAVFLNKRGYADPIAQDMAALLIGKPYPMDTLRLLVEDLKEYTGLYEVSDGDKRKIYSTTINFTVRPVMAEANY